jgi:monoamine oxidase
MQKPDLNKVYDIIIIGAGAAGLYAGYLLSQKGLKVLILEARETTGGRMQTITSSGFSMPVESGAEFVHGQLSLTLQLLEKAGISYYKIGGKDYRVNKGALQQEDAPIHDWDLLMEKLHELQEDITVSEFLQTRFSEAQYEELVKGVKQFVQGYDLADPDTVSTFALHNEWENDDAEHRYRIKGGYTTLVKYLEQQCSDHHADIMVNSAVKHINWKEHEIRITATSGEFYGKQLLVTIGIGAWQSAEPINFLPALPEKTRAAARFGFGSVVKVIVEFEHAFWQSLPERPMPKAGFIFSDAPLPTWWTQQPEEMPVLTGWMGGKQSDHRSLTPADIRHHTVTSLAYIFNVPESYINEHIRRYEAFNWSQQPYIHGAYSYDTLQTVAAREILYAPVQNTIYFAGEALHKGPHPGTVEAALVSAAQTTDLIWQNIRPHPGKNN